MSGSDSFQIHSSFAELVDRYDGFILDQFGVMHNGKHGLDGAPECVEQMAKMGKKLIILSNSSSLSSATVKKLPQLGFPSERFVGAITSGQEASHFIAKNYSTSGKKALFFTWESESSTSSSSPTDFLENCGSTQITENVDEADFIILHGAECLRSGDGSETSLGSFFQTGDVSSMDPMLRKCASKDIPMVCCNPDFVMVKPDGGKAHMPGKIAQHYESMGGKVTVFGKPHVEHFEACLRDLALPKDKVAHVGDSLHHDVVGANATGVDSIFVAGGVHREELGSQLGEIPSREMLEKVFRQHSITPTHVVPLFKM